MEKREAQSVGQIIEQAIRSGNLSENFELQQACVLWGEIVGPGVNRLTTRRYAEGSVLHVYISSAALKSELQYERERIAEHINKALGRRVITDIRIH